jgi:uncharacterized membrane protein YagU involved in acid resistance
MKPSAAASSPGKSKAMPAIFWAGLIAGILDISFAAVSFLLRGRTVGALLKTVAGGALGREALKGGREIALLGLGFHFCISFGAAAVYYAASRKISFLNRHAVVSGLVYGLLVYEFMNLVVLPLSAYHRPFVPPPLFVPDVLSHLFFVGLVIALVTRRYSKD